jgi:dimethylargininase
VQYRRAIVRPPGRNFADGLTSALLGAPSFDAALEQHGRYCDALRACGLELTSLEAEPEHTDGTFVEDAAIVTARGAILTLPGARSRAGETASVGAALIRFYPELAHIDPPGTVDGGDVCEADGHFLIGVSGRTNESGARQLKGFLERLGYFAQLIDIREDPELLHLKTGVAYLGDGIWAAAAAIAARLQDVGARHVIRVPPQESYAVNSVRVNDRVLIASGYPGFAHALERQGLQPLALDMSEFRKMDGGLSCLSLRF